MSNSYSDEQPEKSGTESPSNTHFYSSDAANEKREKFQRLWFYNENLKRDRNNFQSTEVRRREKHHILDAISSKLEIPEYQHKKAKRILEDSNFTDEVEGQYLSLEAYCFAICVFVFNQEVPIPKRHLPRKPDDGNPSHFVSLQDELDISDQKLLQALDELERGVKKNV